MESTHKGTDNSRILKTPTYNRAKHNSFLKLSTIPYQVNNRLWEESSKHQKKARGNVIFRFLKNHFSKVMAVPRGSSLLLPLWRRLPTPRGLDHCRGLASCSGSLHFGWHCRCQRPRKRPNLGMKGGGHGLFCTCTLNILRQHTWHHR